MDRFFGNALCTNQAAHVDDHVDLVLFFLDTFPWYAIWNTVFSIGRSFILSLSIWTPWKDIYARLLKIIYVKLLATKDMEIKDKPKVDFVLNFALATPHRSNAGSRLPNLEHNHHLHVL